MEENGPKPKDESAEIIKPRSKAVRYLLIAGCVLVLLAAEYGRLTTSRLTGRFKTYSRQILAIMFARPQHALEDG